MFGELEKYSKDLGCAAALDSLPMFDNGNNRENTITFFNLDRFMKEEEGCRSAVRRANAHLLWLTPIFGTAIAIVTIAANTFHVITLYAFTKQRPEGLKNLIVRVIKDVTRIICSPMVLVALEIFAFYGVFSPFTSGKLYLNLEITMRRNPVLGSTIIKACGQRIPAEA